MKFRKISSGIILAILLFGLATIAYADDPPKSPDDTLVPTSTPPPVAKGSFDSIPVQPAADVLDPATASVTRLEPTGEDDKSVMPAALPIESPAYEKGSFAPAPLRRTEISEDNVRLIPDNTSIAKELLIGGPAQNKQSSQDVGAAASTQIVFEDFEGAFPPSDPLWNPFDDDGTTNGEYYWDDVPCFPIEPSGWSAWPADNGANGSNLGTADCDAATYPNFADSWLVYGPFSLADAQSASLEFFFRLESESCCDFFKWMASVNGTNFFGQQISGTFTQGPFPNGYNFVSFDLTNVFTLGNLAGQPQVWIAFIFESDFSVTSGGPFIDLISLRKNTDPRVYLTNKDFESGDFPNFDWNAFDNDGTTNGEYYWDDVSLSEGSNCLPHSGNVSIWPADEGANGLNACQGNNYANNMNSWLIHGPFNLEGASEAWVDFYFRNVSETDFDELFWGASTNGTNFSGFNTSGTHVSGPNINGHNLMRLNLAFVPTLGDLRGESEVWLGFQFTSDFSITEQGPFLDDVKVAVERPLGAPGLGRVYLPVILNPPKTTLYIKNSTSDSVTYQVHGAVTCSNLPPGGPHLCGSFAAGTYQVTVNTDECGSDSGPVNFKEGTVEREVKCVEK